MEFSTPLREAKGLGSAKSGRSHWWYQRVSAVVMVPLVLWCMYAAATLPALSHAELIYWLGRPVVAVPIVVLMMVLGFHMANGLQVIIEDYVSSRWKRICAVIFCNISAFFLVVGGCLSVVKIVISGAG